MVKRTASNPSVKAVIFSFSFSWLSGGIILYNLCLCMWDNIQKENAFQDRPETECLISQSDKASEWKGRKLILGAECKYLCCLCGLAFWNGSQVDFSNFLILLSLVFELMVCWRLSQQQQQNYVYACFLHLYGWIAFFQKACVAAGGWSFESMFLLFFSEESKGKSLVQEHV